ncbi:MAG: ECF transporter S component [Oscillospiraceae bacterium]
MTDKKLHRLVLAALFTALTTVMTMVIQVPSPMQGYVNLGDCGVLLSAWVLGPAWGGAAAGIGSMLADLLSGYAHYAPGTLVIKTCMAVAAALILRAFQRGPPTLWRDSWPGGQAAGTILVAGYLRLCLSAAGQGSGGSGLHPGKYRPGGLWAGGGSRGDAGADPQREPGPGAERLIPLFNHSAEPRTVSRSGALRLFYCRLGRTEGTFIPSL